MNTEAHQILVGNLPVDVVRKDIKNLHLGVYPPNGRVRIAAPLRVDDDAVRLFAISKLAWIQRQQAKFAAQERQTPREFVSGESHYFQGRRYLLNVVYDDKPPRVVLRNKKIMDLYVRPRTDVSGRQSVMLGWYRRQLKALAPPLIDKWTDAIDVQLVEWGIKLMKTRWGTCNIEARRIWLNLELIKKPMPCLEYIIVHELVHLLERHHNERFVGLMNRFLPQWRFLREELNRAPLGYPAWEY